MAKGKFTGGKPFPKGKSPNPNGRPKLAPELKQIKYNFGEFLKSGVSQIFYRYLEMPAGEFLAWTAANEATMTMFERYVASCLIKADKEGDMALVERLMDRFLGRPRQAVDLSGQVNTGTQLTPEQLRAMAKEYVKRGDE